LIELPALSEERIRLAFRLALLVCVLAIAYFAFAPPSQAPGTRFDKLNHILAFAVLAWLADMAYPGRQTLGRWTFLLGYGLMIEVVQGFLPYRDLSLLDFAANAAGILCYSIALRLRGRPRRAQARGDKGVAKKLACAREMSTSFAPPDSCSLRIPSFRSGLTIISGLRVFLKT
jgi:VanZ family protein